MFTVECHCSNLVLIRHDEHRQIQDKFIVRTGQNQIKTELQFKGVEVKSSLRVNENETKKKKVKPLLQ